MNEKRKIATKIALLYSKRGELIRKIKPYLSFLIHTNTLIHFVTRESLYVGLY